MRARRSRVRAPRPPGVPRADPESGRRHVGPGRTAPARPRRSAPGARRAHRSVGPQRRGQVHVAARARGIVAAGRGAGAATRRRARGGAAAGRARRSGGRCARLVAPRLRGAHARTRVGGRDAHRTGRGPLRAVARGPGRVHERGFQAPPAAGGRVGHGARRAAARRAHEPSRRRDDRAPRGPAARVARHARVRHARSCVPAPIGDAHPRSRPRPSAQLRIGLRRLSRHA